MTFDDLPDSLQKRFRTALTKANADASDIANVTRSGGVWVCRLKDGRRLTPPSGSRCANPYAVRGPAKPQPLYVEDDLPVFDCEETPFADWVDSQERARAIKNDSNDVRVEAEGILEGLPDQSTNVLTVATNVLTYDQLKEALRVLKPQIGKLKFAPPKG